MQGGRGSEICIVSVFGIMYLESQTAGINGQSTDTNSEDNRDDGS